MNLGAQSSPMIAASVASPSMATMLVSFLRSLRRTFLSLTFVAAYNHNHSQIGTNTHSCGEYVAYSPKEWVLVPIWEWLWFFEEIVIASLLPMLLLNVFPTSSKFDLRTLAKDRYIAYWYFPALTILSGSSPSPGLTMLAKRWVSDEDTITFLSPVGLPLSGIGVDLLKIFLAISMKLFCSLKGVRVGK